ncbi:Cytochrome b561 domain-containing protein 1 [Escovopsis weberi]|uniref:Cytochrome b561 domain-containing protein 1 n=1 Tax=Escovopsis weberi TaxID=150374 RepID=A0A0M8N187_ESCWE|nr:Cytochrome b561 domain-containing protein 1 [Escovopsis weberi]
MASTTGVPPRRPSQNEEEAVVRDETEGEPLLGRPGDASQPEGKSALNNLVLGTGIIAQLGIGLLLVLVWASVLSKPVILFSGHPLSQSLAVAILVQSVLFLQPTHTSDQKLAGQRVHASLNLLALAALAVGVALVEANKARSHGPHMHSAHAWAGAVALAAMAAQYLVGFTMWAAPALYGGEDRAKAVWKYHRWSGYAILLLLLVTVNLATETDYVRNVLKLKLWAVFLLSVVVALGVYPRIQKQKLGLGGSRIAL